MKLASLEKVESIAPAENADALERIKLAGMEWPIISRKGTHKINDVVLYVAIDTVVQRAPWNEFMFKGDQDKATEARVKPIKLRGNISMGLIIPLSEVITDIPKCVIGMEIGKQLGISKYEKPLPLGTDAKGGLPAFIMKTDEDNVMSHPELFEETIGQTVYVTLKMDGTSFTAYNHEGEFGVCSRQLELKETENPYWKVVGKYDLRNKIPDGYYIQGELCGPKINGNNLKLTEYRLFVFNVVKIATREFLNYPDLVGFCHDRQLEIVPTLSVLHHIQENDMAHLVAMANDAKYGENPGEGIVVRPVTSNKSLKTHYGITTFKIINANYKD